VSAAASGRDGVLMAWRPRFVVQLVAGRYCLSDRRYGLVAPGARSVSVDRGHGPRLLIWCLEDVLVSFRSVGGVCLELLVIVCNSGVHGAVG